VTAKELLLKRLAAWTDREAEIALRAVEDSGESNMAPLPAGWDRTVDGRPMPDVVAALDRVRDGR
jgi:hypothetical protein